MRDRYDYTCIAPVRILYQKGDAVNERTLDISDEFYQRRKW